MKQCSVCSVIKNEIEFYKRGNKLRADCKECFKKQVRLNALNNRDKISSDKKRYYRINKNKFQHYRKQLRDEKKSIIEKIKENPCDDCWLCFPYCAMDFDHREPNKKKTGISKILNCPYTVHVLLSELEKCDLVCACCHRNRTYKLWEASKNCRKRTYPSRDRKHVFINSYKTNKPCVDCGKCFNPWQMDFDHLPNKQKKFKISKAATTKVSFEEILQEIDKCELVCVNCHRIRTEKR